MCSVNTPLCHNLWHSCPLSKPIMKEVYAGILPPAEQWLGGSATSRVKLYRFENIG